MLADLHAIFERLNAVGTRYLVCGGFAVIVHGHLRTTHDLDLVLAMDQPNLKKGLSALQELGFEPHLPVKVEEFVDPSVRSRWIREKNMQVFSLVAPLRKDLVVDLFCEPPFDFEEEWKQSLITTFGPGFPECHVVSLKTLREMKRTASRPVDLEDLRQLPDVP
jgi:hypothetical protein